MVFIQQPIKFKKKLSFQKYRFARKLQAVIILSMKKLDAHNKNEYITNGVFIKTLDERFAKQDEFLSHMFELMMNQFELIRFNMEQYRQESRALSRSTLKNESRIDGVDERVLKLEMLHEI